MRRRRTLSLFGPGRAVGVWSVLGKRGGARDTRGDARDTGRHRGAAAVLGAGVRTSECGTRGARDTGVALAPDGPCVRAGARGTGAALVPDSPCMFAGARDAVVAAVAGHALRARWRCARRVHRKCVRWSSRDRCSRSHRSRGRCSRSHRSRGHCSRGCCSHDRRVAIAGMPRAPRSIYPWLRRGKPAAFPPHSQFSTPGMPSRRYETGGCASAVTPSACEDACSRIRAEGQMKPRGKRNSVEKSAVPSHGLRSSVGSNTVNALLDGNGGRGRCVGAGHRRGGADR